MAETWDETTFNKYYGKPLDNNGWLAGYSRESRSMGTFTGRRDRLIAFFGIQPAHRILVGGAALGFLVESFHAAGYANCWGIDDSPYATAGHPDVANGVVLISERVQPGGRIKAILRQETGDDVFDFVITEDVLTCLTDAEIVSEQILFACDGVMPPGGGNVIHLVTHKRHDSQPARYPEINWKTVQEWKDWLIAQGYGHHYVSPMNVHEGTVL